MKERKSSYLKHILEQWTEEAVPTETIHLWPAIQSRLIARPIQPKKGMTTMQTTTRKPSLIRAAALIVATLVILTGLLATHPGQALTRSVMQFIVGSGSPAASLVAPSKFAPRPTATQISVSYSDQCGSFNDPKCSVDQIRGMVKFPVKVIAGEIPASGMDFVGATGGPDQVWLLYRSADLTRSLLLQEGTISFENQPFAPGTPVESLQIGDAPGEYVRGDISDPTGYVWDPNLPRQFLRWTSGGVYYQMDATSLPSIPSYWSNKTGLVSLALSLKMTYPQLTPVPVNTNGTPEPDVANLTVAQAEALAGFHIIVPDKLPRDHFSLRSVSYSPASNTVCLIDGTSLTIAESETAPFPNSNELFPNGFTYEELAVGGGLDNKGLLMSGGLDPEHFCVSKLQSPITDYTQQTEVLQFETQGLKISIYAQEAAYFGQSDINGFVTRMELVRLTETMTGVHTIPDNQPDPEYLHSGKDADTFAGFHVMLPTALFKDEALSYIRVRPGNPPNEVTIQYQINLSVNETPNPTDTLDMIKRRYPTANSANFTEVTIRGQPGLVYIYLGADIDIYWIENGIEYSIWAIYDNQPLQAWIDLANSFK